MGLKREQKMTDKNPLRNNQPERYDPLGSYMNGCTSPKSISNLIISNF